MSELRAFWLLVTGFFVVINTIYLIQLVLAVVAVRRRMRALALEDYRDMRESGDKLLFGVVGDRCGIFVINTKQLLAGTVILARENALFGRRGQ